MTYFDNYRSDTLEREELERQDREMMRFERNQEINAGLYDGEDDHHITPKKAEELVMKAERKIDAQREGGFGICPFCKQPMDVAGKMLGLCGLCFTKGGRR